ncbi:glycosyltransferase family 4 protein [Flavihumibacter sp. RY-1]|uniref:Glycosyltransferase family 4 protein n=1 Tax=Flavihumibacter fluminis TaxID=2909236 RepID=A0ABS9BL05_9BACT|nr:glycosyltransferase family 4 protein [Flavihumibacter fluminis]MCF1716384.1 glycosyltransferase family 4 protein [Flavihumibacter fluminis]
MKIARVFPTFQTDFKYTEHYLAKELKKEGHQTIFVTSDRYLSSWKKYLKSVNPAGVYSYEDYIVYRLKSFFPGEKAIFKEISKCYNLIFKNSVDVIHILGIGTFTTALVLFLSKFKHGSNARILISDHTDVRTHTREGLFANIYYKVLRLLFNLLGGKVYKIITFSNGSVEVLSKRFGIPKNRFSVIPLGYDQDKFYLKRNNSKSNKFTIGFAGKIDPKKRIDFLLNCVNELPFAHDVHIIIAGITSDSYSQKIRSISKKSIFSSELVPFFETEQLADFYNSIDLAVYPGGISITTIEASACGTPVIIFKSIEGLEERVSFGRGLLFESEDELKNAISHYYQLWKNSEIDNKRISEITKEFYSWSNIKNKYLEFYG